MNALKMRIAVVLHCMRTNALPSPTIGAYECTETATGITGTTTTSELAHYYQLLVPTEVILSINNCGSAFDTRLAILDESEEDISSATYCHGSVGSGLGDDCGHCRPRRFHEKFSMPLSPGTYFVKISGFRDLQCGRYSIRFKCREVAASPTAPPISLTPTTVVSTPTTAHTISPSAETTESPTSNPTSTESPLSIDCDGATVHGSTSHSDLVHVYTLTLTQESMVEIDNCLSAFDTTMFILDDSHQDLSSDNACEFGDDCGQCAGDEFSSYFLPHT